MVGNGNRVIRRLAILGSLALVLLAVAPTSPRVRAAGTGPTFRNSAVSGGGFIGVLDQSTAGTLIAGGDTQGLFRSADGGQTWTRSPPGSPRRAIT